MIESKGAVCKTCWTDVHIEDGQLLHGDGRADCGGYLIEVVGEQAPKGVGER